MTLEELRREWERVATEHGTFAVVNAAGNYITALEDECRHRAELSRDCIANSLDRDVWKQRAEDAESEARREARLRELAERERDAAERERDEALERLDCDR